MDLVFSQEPHGWLAPVKAVQEPASRGEPHAPHPPIAAPAPAPVARIGGAADRWPRDLASFAEWWLTEPSLDGGAARGRVPPRGLAGAALMVLVAAPEADDADHLLSGPQGRLLATMLAAMGIAPDQVYIASVLPRHTPLADWGGLAAGGIGAVLGHHVALVAPARIIVFGGNILPLLGHDPAQKTAVLRYFNQEGPSVPLLAAHDLGHLAGRPGAKAAFWWNWLEWD